MKNTDKKEKMKCKHKHTSFIAQGVSIPDIYICSRCKKKGTLEELCQPIEPTLREHLRPCYNPDCELPHPAKTIKPSWEEIERIIRFANADYAVKEVKKYVAEQIAKEREEALQLGFDTTQAMNKVDKSEAIQSYQKQLIRKIKKYIQTLEDEKNNLNKAGIYDTKEVNHAIGAVENTLSLIKEGASDDKLDEKIKSLMNKYARALNKKIYPYKGAREEALHKHDL